MEEKLNMIFEKLLDIEIGMREKEYEKKKEELEHEKKGIECRIDDLKYIREREFERKTEEMCVFRNTGKQKQVEE